MEIANKVGVSDVISRFVEGLKDDNEPYRLMVMETIEQVQDRCLLKPWFDVGAPFRPLSNTPLGMFSVYVTLPLLCAVCYVYFLFSLEVFFYGFFFPTVDFFIFWREPQQRLGIESIGI